MTAVKPGSNRATVFGFLPHHRQSSSSCSSHSRTAIPSIKSPVRVSISPVASSAVNGVSFTDSFTYSIPINEQPAIRASWTDLFKTFLAPVSSSRELKSNESLINPSKLSLSARVLTALDAQPTPGFIITKFFGRLMPRSPTSC